MREAHRVLAGRDPWAGITVQRDHVRRQLEHELVWKLVRLRQAYAALRLTGRLPSGDPTELVRAAGAAMGWPAESLAPLVADAVGGRRLRLVAGDPLPAAYLAALARTA